MRHENNHILRTMILLTALAIGTNISWGQTSLGKAEITAAPTSTSDENAMETTSGTIYALYKGTTTEIDFSANNGANQLDEKWYVKLVADGFIKIRVAKGTVIAGDILRVEVRDIYNYTTQQTLGFQVEGSNETIGIKETDNALHTLDYTLKAADIQSEDASYDFIKINRNGNSGCGYHSVEILQPAHHTVSIDLAKFTPGLPTGCDAWFTIGDDPTKYREAKTVVEGTSITYTMSSTNPHYTPAGWRTRSWQSHDTGWMVWGSSFTTTVRSSAAKTEGELGCDGGNHVWSDHEKLNYGNINAAPEFTYHEGCVVTFSANNNDYGTVTATVGGNPITSGSLVASDAEVQFTATPSSGDYLAWGWNVDGKDNWSFPNPYTVTKDVTIVHNFTSGIKINAYPNNGSLGTINISGGGKNGTNIHITPWAGPVTFTATPKAGATFDGWYSDVDLTDLITSETTLTYTNDDNILRNPGTVNRWAKFTAIPFDPALDLNSTTHGSNATMSEGVLTATGSSDNWVKVKDITGQGNNYTGIRLTTQGKACRIIVRWGEADATQKVTYVDAAEKATTSYYSWSMLGVPENEVANLTSIRFAGASSDFGTTTFSNASLVNVTETTPYARQVGELRDFNLNDTRVQLYGHDAHYQMGGNIQWVYKVETAGDKFVTMKTTGTSWNQMEIFHSGHYIPTYDGVRVDYKGKHFRVIAYTGDGADDKFVATAPNADNRTARYITWSEFLRGGAIMTENDIRNIKRIEVAGCSEHDAEEAVNFYSIRLHKRSTDVIYTDESTTIGGYNAGVLTFRENQDGKEVSVAFSGIYGGDRHADGCNGTIIRRDEHDSFTVSAPECYKVTKVIVGLGEKTTGTGRFNNTENVTVNDQNQITWTNTTEAKSVTMTIPDGAANENFHITYVYYELEEIAIPSIDVNGKKREYATYVPDGISGQVGVIISLHGASNDYYNGRVDFNAIADAKKDIDDKKFIVVYPRGLLRQLRGQERGWESYTESNTEDVEFFKAIVKELDGKNGLTVDYSRIYLAGFSNGGMMAYKAAHQAADFFAAFASVGGYPVNESHLFHAGSQPTPFIHIQGAADGVFPSTTYDLSTIAHNMTYRNGAHFNPYDTGHNSDGGVVPAHSNVTREIHVADEGGAAYFLYTIAGMGHTWSYNWDGNAGDDVAQSIWNFFDYNGKISRDNKGNSTIDKTLKFRINDPDELWTIATTGKSKAEVEVGYVGLDDVNAYKDNKNYVLSYGGRTKTSTNSDTFNKDSNNKNLWHSLQFQGGINGAAHFLKLNVETEKKNTEDPNEFFLVKLTKTGESTPVFAKRYQAGRGHKDLYINFVALPGFNEYKLEITKSSSDLVVMIHGIEAYSGKCEDKSTNEKQIEENPTAFYDVATVLTGMNPIYQPIFGKSYNGIAKEFLPIAEIPVGIIPAGDIYRPSDIPTKDDKNNDYVYRVINDTLKTDHVLTSLPSTVIASTGWTENKGRYTATITGNTLFSLAQSGKTGEDTEIKSDNAFIFAGATEKYTIDRVKGLNISEHGRAMMPEYLNGTRGAFPDHGVIAIKLQGTLDFYLLAQNEVTYSGTDPNPARRTLKVYYTNDQLDGELKELEEWWFYGTRSENGYSNTNGNSLGALSAGVRLPQLGKDGTCTVFITYEGNGQHQSFTHAAEDEDKIWIKGFVIKRPDLKVTIGRTDSKYSSQTYKGENNTTCTRFGENKPYIWSFENIGFNNTRNKEGHRDINDKKINEKDGRTYVCGGTDDSVDHLLLYSNATSSNNDDKVQFDGRKLGNEHIEFLKESVYDMKNKPVTDRKLYDPIKSNGLKVNVTGSGWFKIKCTAPNGPVNMKVYTQPNYGSSYISLLREFRVEKSTKETEEEREIDWKEYTVYLKSRGIHDGYNGFWDGATTDNGKEEIMRQSLFVVFDKVDETTYDESHPQLNIHELSWLNEEPADYVFQREEDPKLLTEWQKVKRDLNGDGNVTEDEVVLWWKAGNDDDTKYTMLKENGNDTYDRLGQFTTNIADGKGVKSPGGYASASVPSDAGTYDAYWDIAAPASTGSHKETAYAKGNKVITAVSPQYEKSGSNTEFDIPVSGSFVRICAMKNTYVVAHVIPGAANGKVYVLDETGSPLGFDGSSDDGKIRGYIATMSNVTENAGEKQSTDGTIRIDFTANAGKEYFICAKDASLSLARLEVHDWRYNPEKAANKLEVADNKKEGKLNSKIISEAFDAGTYYMDANLSRKLANNNWISLVLPFSMNEKKFEEVFGQGARGIHFTDVDIPGKTVKLTHHYYNMIVAGRPVFVKPNNPNVDASDYLKDIMDVTLQTKDVNTYKSPNEDFEFFASYDNTTMKRNDLFMNNANTIKYLTDESATYPGMRSFIKNISGPDFYNIIGTSPSTPSPTKASFLNFCDLDEDTATGIEELITAEFGENVVIINKSTKVYDLNGRIVAEGANIENLPTGIYIVNGKKYFAK
ncbi:MAG: prolyl oligopeptidase family serine peptidase [Prevotella sp.]|nr:prolyl oligopeptidase family serine peptidase [Candidatus Prevotella equi]